MLGGHSDQLSTSPTDIAAEGLPPSAEDHLGQGLNGITPSFLPSRSSLKLNGERPAAE
jgi:hypothetical protein